MGFLHKGVVAIYARGDGSVEFLIVLLLKCAPLKYSGLHF